MSLRFRLRFVRGLLAALGFLSLPFTGWSEAFTWELAAGASGGVGLIDGSGTDAAFNAPSDTALDSAGNLYVADYYNRAIRKITPSGEVSTWVATPGVNDTVPVGNSVQWRLPRVSGLTVDAVGNVYAVGDGAVFKVSPDRQVTVLVTSSYDFHYYKKTGLYYPFGELSGVAMDASGALFVSDSDYHRILKIDLSAGTVKLWAGDDTPIHASGLVDGTGTAARFKHPRGLGIDRRSGFLYVADSGNNRVRRISLSRVVTTLTQGAPPVLPMNSPSKVDVDGSGNLYVTDTENHRILKMDVLYSPPPRSIFAGSGIRGHLDGLGTAAQFSSPSGITTDPDGTLWVTDTDGHIRKVSSEGVVTTFAGSTVQPGQTDGSAAEARFNAPCAVKADAEGNLYVADRDNATIRKISPTGVVTTVTGVANDHGTIDGPAGVARLSSPTYLARDPQGNLYVASPYQLRRISPDGSVETIAGSTAGFVDGPGSAARFDSIAGITVDASGNIYVADNGNAAIRRISPEGVVTTLAGKWPDGTKTAEFSALGDLVAAPDGALYVMDREKILRVTPSGGTTKVTSVVDATNYSAPKLAIDAAGNLYYGDYYTVFKYSPDGAHTEIGGLQQNWGNLGGTGSEARFAKIGGLAVLADGTVCVTNSTGHSVYRGRDLSTDRPLLTQPASQTSATQPFTVAFELTEAAKDGTLTMTFAGAQTRILTISGQRRRAGKHSFVLNPDSPLRADNVGEISGGSTIPDGVYTVTLSYQDALGHAAASAVVQSFTLDRTPPTASVAPSIFVPAGPTGIAVLGDLIPEVTRSDEAMLDLAITQTPDASTILPRGTHEVSFAVRDTVGHVTTVSTMVTVDFVRPAAPLVSAGRRAGPMVKGGPTGEVIPPGTGLPEGTSFGGWFSPALGDDRQMVARATLWDDRRSLGAIYQEDGGGAQSLLAYQGGPVRDIDGQVLEGVTFQSFLDPIIAPGGAVAFGAKISGEKAGPRDDGWWTDLFSPVPGEMRLILCESRVVPDTNGARLKAVTSVSLQDNGLLALVSLERAKDLVTAADDVALVFMTGPDEGRVLLREGRPLDGANSPVVKSFSVLQPAQASAGQGRWHGAETTLAKVKLITGEMRIVALVNDGSSVQTILSTVNEATVVAPGARWQGFGLPTLGQPAIGTVSAQLKNKIGGVTTASDSALLLTTPEDGWKILARENDPAPVAAAAGAGTPRFATFFEPVVNGSGKAAFLATLRGPGITASNKTHLFSGLRDQLGSIARLGQLAPDFRGETDPAGPKWSRFVTYALPEAATGGVLFVAELSGQGVTAGNKLGLWAEDSHGLVRELLRTGKSVEAGGPVLTRFTLLNALPGSYGTARSYNASGSVAVQATFADKSQRLLRIDLP